MKKMFMVLMIALAVMFCWLAPVGVVVGDVTDFGGGESIDIKPVKGGDQFEVTLYSVKLTSKGVDRPYEAEVVRIASGVLDAAMASGNRNVVSSYIADAEVTGGKAIFQLTNYAKTVGDPVIEHLWGIGRSAGDSGVKYLILNPASQWVVFEGGNQPDLETLAIGILMCPNGTPVPLKSLGKGKLKQGRHPELAYACEARESLSLDLEVVKR